MKTITVADVRYIVIRELGTDSEAASRIRSTHGGALIRNSKDNTFMLCQRIGEAEYEEV